MKKSIAYQAARARTITKTNIPLAMAELARVQIALANILASGWNETVAPVDTTYNLIRHIVNVEAHFNMLKTDIIAVKKEQQRIQKNVDDKSKTVAAKKTKRPQVIHSRHKPIRQV